MVQWLRLHTPSTGGPGSILGQGTRSHALQVKVHMSQLKIPHAKTKAWGSKQINRLKINKVIPKRMIAQLLAWWSLESVNEISSALPRAIKQKSTREVAQSYATLFDSMGCSLPDSSVHGIFQARVLEWVTISFSRGSSRPRDRTQLSRIAGRRFTLC